MAITHNKRHTPEYLIWAHMKTRCYNKNYKLYHCYGGRGIIVCDRWLNSFENFISDMGKRPTSKHSLDRFPNQNGIYEPENCRWATPKEQQGNRRNNKWIEHNGKRMIQADWARELNMDVRKLHHHLKNFSINEIIEMCNNGGIIDKRAAPNNKRYYKNTARSGFSKTGANNPRSIKIIQLNKKTGKKIKTFHGISEAARVLKIYPQNIGKALHDNAKSAGGYKWALA